jgi:hypothetical protein
MRVFRKPSGYRRMLFAYAVPILRKHGISAREFNRIDFARKYPEANAELEIAKSEFYATIAK